MVSVGVSRMGKTGIVFVETGAKVSSEYYCQHVAVYYLTSVQDASATPGLCSRTAHRHTLLGTCTHWGWPYLRRTKLSLTCGLQTARTWIQSITLSGVPFSLQQNGLSTSTIHDNQPAKAGDRHWVGQIVAAFHWSRHWSVASPAWVLRPTARRTHWTFDVKTAWCNSYFRQ